MVLSIKKKKNKYLKPKDMVKKLSKCWYFTLYKYTTNAVFEILGWMALAAAVTAAATPPEGFFAKAANNF